MAEIHISGISQISKITKNLGKTQNIELMGKMSNLWNFLNPLPRGAAPGCLKQLFLASSIPRGFTPVCFFKVTKRQVVAYNLTVVELCLTFDPLRVNSRQVYKTFLHGKDQPALAFSCFGLNKRDLTFPPQPLHSDIKQH